MAEPSDVGAQTQAQASGSARRPRGRSAFVAKLLAILVAVVAEIWSVVFDPVGFETATANASAEITARIMAPFYGFAADDPDNVHRPTREIAVVLFTDESLKTLDAQWPLPYAKQYALYRKILDYQPKAVFLDLLYQYDRNDQLAQFVSRLARAGEAKTQAAQAGVVVEGGAGPTNGIVVSVLGEEAPSIYADALPVAQTGFEIGVVGMANVGPTYTLVQEHQGYDLSDGAPRRWDAPRATPTAALRMLELHCKTARALGDEAAASLPGCRDLETLQRAPPLNSIMALYWGTLSQETWEPLGDLSLEMADKNAPEIAGDSATRRAALIEQENQDPEGCRYFAPDLWSRAYEAGRQLLLSFSVMRSLQRDKICSYSLTIPAHHLASNHPDMRAYLERALAGKSVIVGVSIAGATDRIKLLNRAGIGVYAHAMALDNLLAMGAHYMREPAIIDSVFGVRDVFGFELARLGMQYDDLLEIGVILLLLLIYFLMRPPLHRFITGAPRWRLLRWSFVLLLWAVVVFVITILVDGAAYLAFGWRPHNWMVTIVAALFAARVFRRFQEPDADDNAEVRSGHA